MLNNLQTRSNQIVCSRLTAAGRGAIAVVEVRGFGAAKKIENVFQPFNGRPFSNCLQRKMIYGTWTPTGEDVVVCVLPGDRFEVHCHGGTAAVDSVIAALIDQGATEESSSRAPGELGDVASRDLWRAEVWQALPDATTTKTASLMLRQLDLLPAAIVRLEETLGRGDSAAAIALMDQILKWSDFGVSLTQVPSVVLCGQPNVGKSSLINAVVGFQRAIVHQSAGTTRDVVSQRTAVDGWPIEISDTAGLRNAQGTVEGIGIENARQKIETARLVIGVFDASRPWSEADQSLLESLDCDIVIHNKSDCSDSGKTSTAKSDARPPGVATSATQNEGIEQMVSLIATKLVPELPPEDAAWCVTEAAVARLEKARTVLAADGSRCDQADCERAAKILAGVSANGD
jgi:tRNA modification GTPase